MAKHAKNSGKKTYVPLREKTIYFFESNKDFP